MGRFSKSDRCSAQTWKAAYAYIYTAKAGAIQRCKQMDGRDLNAQKQQRKLKLCCLLLCLRCSSTNTPSSALALQQKFEFTCLREEGINQRLNMQHLHHCKSHQQKQLVPIRLDDTNMSAFTGNNKTLFSKCLQQQVRFDSDDCAHVRKPCKHRTGCQRIN